MAYSVEDIDKILGFTSWSDKRKIEKLLEIDADLYCNLGKESTKTDIEYAFVLAERCSYFTVFLLTSFLPNTYR